MKTIKNTIKQDNKDQIRDRLDIRELGLTDAQLSRIAGAKPPPTKSPDPTREVACCF